MNKYEAFESINKQNRLNTIPDSKQCENSMFSTQEPQKLKHLNILIYQSLMVNSPLKLAKYPDDFTDYYC